VRPAKKTVQLIIEPNSRLDVLGAWIQPYIANDRKDHESERALQKRP
jgi:hypothetical protein